MALKNNNKFVSKSLPKPATATPQGIQIPEPDPILTRAEKIKIEVENAPKAIDSAEILPTPAAFGDDDEDAEVNDTQTEKEIGVSVVKPEIPQQTSDQKTTTIPLPSAETQNRPNIGRPIIETVEDEQGKSIPQIEKVNTVTTQRNLNNNIQTHTPIQPEIIDFSKVNSQPTTSEQPVNQSPIDQFIQNSDTPIIPTSTDKQINSEIPEPINTTPKSPTQPEITATPDFPVMPITPTTQNPQIPEEVRDLSGQNQKNNLPNWEQPGYIQKTKSTGNKNKILLKNIMLIAGLILSGTILVMIGYFTAPKLMGKNIKKSTNTNNQNNNIQSTPVPTPAPTPTPEPKIDLSTLKIKILNGSGKKGEATRAKNALKDLQFSAIATGNADNFEYKDTEINYKTNYRKVFADLKKALSPNYNLILGEKLSTDDKYDLYIILGSDKSQLEEVKTASSSAINQ